MFAISPCGIRLRTDFRSLEDFGSLGGRVLHNHARSFRCLYLTCLVLLVSSSIQADDPTKKPDAIVREINAPPRGTGEPRGNPRNPTEITTADQLAKVFPDKDGAARVQKEVDFDKQKLVFFAWAGSGQDRIRPTIAETKEGKEVVFLFRAGRTKDLRQHAHLFVVDRKVKWRVANDMGNQ